MENILRLNEGMKDKLLKLSLCIKAERRLKKELDSFIFKSEEQQELASKYRKAKRKTSEFYYKHLNI